MPEPVPEPLNFDRLLKLRLVVARVGEMDLARWWNTNGLLVLGDMSIQGNIKPVRTLTEPLQVAVDNGAKRALIPIENNRQFLDVNPDVLEQVDPIFYGDLSQAAFKALGLN